MLLRASPEPEPWILTLFSTILLGNHLASAALPKVECPAFVKIGAEKTTEASLEAECGVLLFMWSFGTPKQESKTCKENPPRRKLGLVRAMLCDVSACGR